MLTELRVRDLAVIADATLRLGPGLNVLTGETGAGKSMLVDALALLLGERASADLVRPGADRAVVEAAFEGVPDPVRTAAEAAGVDVDDRRLVVRREIRLAGANRAWANGSPTTVGVLADLGRLLVDLHGQHEAQSLLRAPAQRAILDAYADARADLAAVRTAWEEAARLRADEAALAARRDDVQKRADYLGHVVQEIEAARPAPGEEDALDAEARRLGHGEELTRLAGELAGLLDAEDVGAVERLGAADRVLSQLEKYDPTVAGWRELLDAAYAAAEELTRAVREYESDIDLDPARLEAVERRRDVLYRLRQKYGATLEAVLATRDEAARELELLETADVDLDRLRERRSVAEQDFARAARTLTARRRRAAGRLAKDVGRHLPGLGMPGGRFQAVVGEAERPGPQGADAVSFLVQLNPGLDARPLAQVASGGELSRLMLALKVVLARHDAIPTLVFDEVDQGIGGEVGGAVAEALAQVATDRQVLVITHLPQIAARAARHLRVSKRAREGVASATVAVLEGADREVEVARMLGDAEDRALRQHAGQLLRRSPVTP